MKKNDLDERVISYAKEYLEMNKDGMMDIRTYANLKKCSKSLIGSYFKTKLKAIDYKLYEKYEEIAKRNKLLGQIKGGYVHLKNRKQEE